MTKTVDIHHIVHGRIIGSKGAGVKKLQENYKVRIVFPNDKQSNTLEVSGLETDVDNCIEQLKQVQEEYVSIGVWRIFPGANTNMLVCSRRLMILKSTKK